MTGLIAPLSKTGTEIPTHDRTRPITILPQVFRLWAAVMCSQMARAICVWAPSSITGFLPARGANNAALQSHWNIESSRSDAVHLSGLALDLQKCFNCIRWKFSFRAMLFCGFPVAMLLMQTIGLGQLRGWMIVRCCFGVPFSTAMQWVLL